MACMGRKQHGKVQQALDACAQHTGVDIHVHDKGQAQALRIETSDASIKLGGEGVSVSWNKQSEGTPATINSFMPCVIHCMIYAIHMHDAHDACDMI